MTPEEELLDRITVDPEILVGKPAIRGTRISVEQILRLLGAGMTVEEILDDYPHVTEKDIRACLVFAGRALEDVTWTPFMATA